MKIARIKAQPVLFKRQDISALIPVHMVPLPSIQYPRVDSIAFDVLCFVPPPTTWGLPMCQTVSLYIASLPRPFSLWKCRFIHLAPPPPI